MFSVPTVRVPIIAAARAAPLAIAAAAPLWVALLAASLAALLAASLAGCQVTTPPCPPGAVAHQERAVRFDPAPQPDLTDAELAAALPAWRQSCIAWSRRPSGARWAALCDGLGASADPVSPAVARARLAGCCDAWRIVSIDAPAVPAVSAGCTPPPVVHTRGLMTGYFEPELSGSRYRRAPTQVPLYGVPSDLVTVDLAAVIPELQGKRVRGRLVTSDGALRIVPYWSRAEIDQGMGPAGGPLAWADDALAAFLLQVQGSGRVVLDDGSRIRVGYADTNGFPYRSIGRWLVDQGELTLSQATLAGIVGWARAHPERLAELLESNPSYVFFRELPLGDAALGPTGALGVPLTPDRSVAIDPRFIPLGAPLVTAGDDGLPHLVFGQDTGGAIRGPLRFDLFRGTGEAAGAAAGEQRDQVEGWLLAPKGVAPADLLPPPAPPSGSSGAG